MKQFPSEKDPDEPSTVTIDWIGTGKVTSATSFTNPEVAVTVANGVDAGVAAMVSGASAMDGTVLTKQKQLLINGVDGVDYVVCFETDTDNADFPHLVERVRLRCRTDRE